MKRLTDRQREILHFIKDYIQKHRYSPTCREIGEHFGFSFSNAFNILNALRRKGCLEWEDGKPRTHSLLPPYNDTTRHAFVIETDIPDLNIKKGDYLDIDTAEPIADGDVVISKQGHVKRFHAGDTGTFGKVTSISREVE